MLRRAGATVRLLFFALPAERLGDHAYRHWIACHYGGGLCGVRRVRVPVSGRCFTDQPDTDMKRERRVQEYERVGTACIVTV